MRGVAVIEPGFPSSVLLRRGDDCRGGLGWEMGKVLLSVPNHGSVVGPVSGSLPPVVMMQTADQRHLEHLPTFGQLHRSRDRTVMGQGSMRADFVVISKEVLKNLA